MHITCPSYFGLANNRSIDTGKRDELAVLLEEAHNRSRRTTLTYMLTGHATAVLAIAMAAASFVSVIVVESAQLSLWSGLSFQSCMHVTRCCSRASCLRFPFRVVGSADSHELGTALRRGVGPLLDVLGFLLIAALGVYMDFVYRGGSHIHIDSDSVEYSIYHFRYIATFGEVLLSSAQMLSLRCSYSLACTQNTARRAVGAKGRFSSVDAFHFEEDWLKAVSSVDNGPWNLDDKQVSLPVPWRRVQLALSVALLLFYHDLLDWIGHNGGW